MEPGISSELKPEGKPEGRRLPAYTVGEETFLLRAACINDARAVAEVKQNTWPEENVRPDRITQALSSPDHTTILAVHEDQVVGFVDSFITKTPEGERWEVDLLAIDPAFRGRRLGEALVAKSCRAASAKGVAFSRALIQLNNVASQITFARGGFQTDKFTYHLYVAADPLDGVEALHPGGCIEVATMNYYGIWIEPDFTRNSLIAGRRRLKTDGYDLAGAVIPVQNPGACQSAAETGYSFVGAYQWWTKGLSDSS